MAPRRRRVRKPGDNAVADSSKPLTSRTHATYAVCRDGCGGSGSGSGSGSGAKKAVAASLADTGGVETEDFCVSDVLLDTSPLGLYLATLGHADAGSGGGGGGVAGGSDGDDTDGVSSIVRDAAERYAGKLAGSDDDSGIADGGGGGGGTPNVLASMLRAATALWALFWPAVRGSECDALLYGGGVFATMFGAELAAINVLRNPPAYNSLTYRRTDAYVGALERCMRRLRVHASGLLVAAALLDVWIGWRLISWTWTMLCVSHRYRVEVAFMLAAMCLLCASLYCVARMYAALRRARLSLVTVRAFVNAERDFLAAVNRSMSVISEITLLANGYRVAASSDRAPTLSRIDRQSRIRYCRLLRTKLSLCVQEHTRLLKKIATHAGAVLPPSDGSGARGSDGAAPAVPAPTADAYDIGALKAVRQLYVHTLEYFGTAVARTLPSDGVGASATTAAPVSVGGSLRDALPATWTLDAAVRVTADARVQTLLLASIATSPHFDDADENAALSASLPGGDGSHSAVALATHSDVYGASLAILAAKLAAVEPLIAYAGHEARAGASDSVGALVHSFMHVRHSVKSALDEFSDANLAFLRAHAATKGPATAGNGWDVQLDSGQPDELVGTARHRSASGSALEDAMDYPKYQRTALSGLVTREQRGGKRAGTVDYSSDHGGGGGGAGTTVRSSNSGATVTMNVAAAAAGGRGRGVSTSRAATASIMGELSSVLRHRSGLPGSDVSDGGAE